MDSVLNCIQINIDTFIKKLNEISNMYDSYKITLQSSNTKLLNFTNKYKKMIIYDETTPIDELSIDFNYNIYQKKIELEQIVEEQYNNFKNIETEYFQYVKFKNNMIETFENLKNTNIIKLYNILKEYKIEGLNQIELDYFQIKFNNNDINDKLSINITWKNNQYNITKLRIKNNRKIIPFKTIFIQDINETIMFIISYCVKVNNFRK